MRAHRLNQTPLSRNHLHCPLAWNSWHKTATATAARGTRISGPSFSLPVNWLTTGSQLCRGGDEAQAGCPEALISRRSGHGSRLGGGRRPHAPGVAGLALVEAGVAALAQLRLGQPLQGEHARWTAERSQRSDAEGDSLLWANGALLLAHSRCDVNQAKQFAMGIADLKQLTAWHPTFRHWPATGAETTAMTDDHPPPPATASETTRGPGPAIRAPAARVVAAGVRRQVKARIISAPMPTL
jgi:hypothetical protein